MASIAPQEGGETAFFRKTYGEAFSLLVETEAYLSHYHPIGDDFEDPIDMLVVRTEAFRLSSRLMQVAAWLLAQRAVLNGEIDAGTFAREPGYRPGARSVCRDDRKHDHPAIPAALTDLLERSLRLYVRIERLDEMHCRTLH